MATTPTTTTTTPPSTPIILNIDYLNESWCELHYKSSCSSTGSISHLNHSVNPEVLEKLLQEAQRESSPSSQFQFYSNLSNATNYNYSSNSLILEPLLRNYEDESSDSRSSFNVISDTTQSPTLPVTSALNCNKCHQSSSSATLLLSTSLEKNEKLQPNFDINYEDDVDLEYVDEDEQDDEKDVSKEIKHNIDKEKKELSHSCQHCTEQKKQIEILIEKQIYNEKQLIKLRKEYEDKLLLNNSLNLTTSSSSTSFSSASSTPPSLNSNQKKLQTSNVSNVKIDVNDSNSNVNNNSNSNPSTNYNSNNEWMKYWSSRPQVNPPKEWNFVHPNSSKSKLNQSLMSKVSIQEELNNNEICSKLLNKTSIGKLLFTHMASFILGATLMFLVIRKHLNVRGSIYYI